MLRYKDAIEIKTLKPYHRFQNQRRSTAVVESRAGDINVNPQRLFLSTPSSPSSSSIKTSPDGMNTSDSESVSNNRSLNATLQQYNVLAGLYQRQPVLDHHVQDDPSHDLPHTGHDLTYVTVSLSDNCHTRVSPTSPFSSPSYSSKTDNKSSDGYQYSFLCLHGFDSSLLKFHKYYDTSTQEHNCHFLDDLGWCFSKRLLVIDYGSAKKRAHLRDSSTRLSSATSTLTLL